MNLIRNYKVLCIGLRKRHGNGKMEYDNGEELTGEWLNDKLKDGHVTKSYKIILPNGDKYSNYYEGDFKDGKRFAKGKIIINYIGSRGIYNGNWLDDKRNGLGTMINRYGDVYEGEWENDVFKSGKLKFSNNTDKRTERNWTIDNQSLSYDDGISIRHDLGGVYEGQFKSYKRHGKGKMIYNTNIKTRIPKAGDGLIKLIEFNGEWLDDEWRSGKLKYEQENKSGKFISKELDF